MSCGIFSFTALDPNDLTLQNPTLKASIAGANQEELSGDWTLTRKVTAWQIGDEFLQGGHWKVVSWSMGSKMTSSVYADVYFAAISMDDMVIISGLFI